MQAMADLVCRTHGYASAEEHRVDPLFCLWVPAEDMVRITLRYQVECAACGPLEAGLHGTLDGAETDMGNHLGAHRRGAYAGDRS